MKAHRVVGPAAVLLGSMVVASCSSAPQPFMGSAERGQMRAHYELAGEMVSHAIEGDLERLRDVAQQLALLDNAPDLEPGLVLQFGPMRREAQGATLARTAAEGAEATAEVARTCGDCHRANGVTLGAPFLLQTPPLGNEGNRHMGGLEWVTSQMWAGLIGPSDAAWSTAADALVEWSELPDLLPRNLPAQDARRAAQSLRRAGIQASGAVDQASRATALAFTWSTCSGCHERR